MDTSPSTNKINIFLLITSILSTLILIIGTTFSYFSITNMSDVDALAVEAGKISLGLGVAEEHAGHLLIPLDDKNISVAYKQNCLDDLGRGACVAYKLRLFNYSKEHEVEGKIDFTISDIENLSYMVLDSEGNTYQDITHIDSNNSKGLSLGKAFTIDGGTESNASVKYFTLLIWLTNYERDQNEEDAAGNFEAVVTYNSSYSGRLTATVKGMESSIKEPSVIN